MEQTNEEILAASLQQFRPMIASLVRGTGIDPDDAEQEIALKLWQLLPTLPTVAPAYLRKVVKYQTINLLRKLPQPPPLSLDKPLADDMTLTLADIIPAPDTQSSGRGSRAIYAALRGLSADDLRHLRSFNVKRFRASRRAIDEQAHKQ